MAWFAIPAIVGIARAAARGPLVQRPGRPRPQTSAAARRHASSRSRSQVTGAIAILLALVFSKYIYLASLSSYYTFYLISRFQVSVRLSQILLFVFLGAVAAGTLIGGPWATATAAS